MREPDFLRPLDLHHARIMHHDLHNAEAQFAYLFGHQFQPVGWFHRFVQRRLHDVGENRFNLYYVNRYLFVNANIHNYSHMCIYNLLI